MTGLYQVWRWGLGRQAASCVLLLPAVVHGLSWAHQWPGEGSLGNSAPSVEKEGWLLFQWPWAPHENGQREGLSLRNRVQPHHTGECGLETPLIPPTMGLGLRGNPRGHREKLPAVLALLGRANAAGCARTPPVGQRLRMGTSRHIWAVCYPPGDRKPAAAGTKGLVRIQNLDWPPSERM